MTTGKLMIYGGIALAVVMLILMMKGTYSAATFIAWGVVAAIGGGTAWWGQQLEGKEALRRLREDRDNDR